MDLIISNLFGEIILIKHLINSKMGLNLSRGLPTKYYSSNRIASLMGNGLLTFIDEKKTNDDFFNKMKLFFITN